MANRDEHSFARQAFDRPVSRVCTKHSDSVVCGAWSEEALESEPCLLGARVSDDHLHGLVGLAAEDAIAPHDRRTLLGRSPLQADGSGEAVARGMETGRRR